VVVWHDNYDDWRYEVRKVGCCCSVVLHVRSQRRATHSQERFATRFKIFSLEPIRPLSLVLRFVS